MSFFDMLWRPDNKTRQISGREHFKHMEELDELAEQTFERMFNDGTLEKIMNGSITITCTGVNNSGKA